MTTLILTASEVGREEVRLGGEISVAHLLCTTVIMMSEFTPIPIRKTGIIILVTAFSTPNPAPPSEQEGAQMATQ